MPKIAEQASYGAAEQKITRLGLTPLFEEIKKVLTDFSLLVKEAKDANGGAVVRKLMDERFKQARDWIQKVTGDIDWTKCRTVNGTKVCIGVELQFSGRSDLVVIDIIHLRAAITGGVIDVGVLVVPSNRLGHFLTDRAPKFADATRHIKEARAEDLPLIVLGLEHDGPGDPLPKQMKRAKKLIRRKKLR